MLRQIALTAGTRLGLTVFGLVTSIVTARFLGQSGRGDYFFMVTLAALIVQFANLGLPSSNTYFAARDPERTPQLVANALWVSLGVGGGLGVGIALFAHAVGMLQDTPASYLWLAAALAPPDALLPARHGHPRRPGPDPFLQRAGVRRPSGTRAGVHRGRRARRRRDRIRRRLHRRLARRRCRGGGARRSLRAHLVPAKLRAPRRRIPLRDEGLPDHAARVRRAPWKHLPAPARVRPRRPRPLLDRDANRGRAHSPAAGRRDDPPPAPRPRCERPVGADRARRALGRCDHGRRLCPDGRRWRGR